MKEKIFVLISILLLAFATWRLSIIRAARAPYPEQVGETLAFKFSFPAAWSPISLKGDPQIDDRNASLEGKDPVAGDCRIYISLIPTEEIESYVAKQRKGDSTSSAEERWHDAALGSFITWTTVMQLPDAQVRSSRMRHVVRHIPGAGVAAASMADGGSFRTRMRLRYLSTRILSSISTKHSRNTKK